MLISLGVIAAITSVSFGSNDHVHSLHSFIGYALAAFFTCISLMMGLLDLPDIAGPIKRPVRISLLVTALVFLVWSLSGINAGTIYNLVIVIGILIVEIIYLNLLYYSLNIDESKRMEN
jgi:hypothetical protein